MCTKVYAAAEKAKEKGEDELKAMTAAAEEVSRKIAKEGDRLQSYVDRKRKDFARLAAGLAEKRLELASVEKQYHETK
jgi:hypothetical protein